MLPKSHYTKIIKDKAYQLGFLHCGISKAEFLEEEAPKLEHWLESGHHGKMSYMENYFDMRLDPRLIVEGARSVISLSYNYYPEKFFKSKDSLKISKYALGKDYHKVVKDKARLFLDFIKKEVGEVSGRVFVDSAPVLERALAKRSGLGWVGKNGNLINKKQGSFFFLAEIIIDLELDYDQMVTDHCGTCTKCIDFCPTEAIIEPFQIDSNKCISYLTIEYREALPDEFSDKMNDWIFGCDICQDVCPWNRFSKPHQESQFQPHFDLLEMTRSDWNQINKETYQKLFKNSAVKRTKFSGLQRNIDFLK